MCKEFKAIWYSDLTYNRKLTLPIGLYPALQKWWYAHPQEHLWPANNSLAAMMKKYMKIALESTMKTKYKCQNWKW
jgi:hypothetical protein